MNIEHTLAASIVRDNFDFTDYSIKSFRIQASATQDEILVDLIVADQWSASFIVTFTEIRDAHGRVIGLDHSARQVALP